MKDPPTSALPSGDTGRVMLWPHYLLLLLTPCLPAVRKPFPFVYRIGNGIYKVCLLLAAFTESCSKQKSRHYLNSS
jgi:hypothetical protein